MSNNQTTVQTILDWLNQTAPFDTQEEFDNAGLQIGYGKMPVSAVLVTLDVTEEVILEAAALKANLIIAHHPLLFTPQRDLNLARFVPRLAGMLIQHNIALIAVHTNMDQSFQYSASFALAELLNLKQIRQQGKYLIIGDLSKPLDDEQLFQLISRTLKAPVRQYGQGKTLFTTLAIAGGAYSEGFEEASEAGAQALLTGEVRHHHAVEAVDMGIVLYDGGHYATEVPMLPPLALGLQTALDTLEYPVQVHVTQCMPYRLL
jgi:dinuclear metal center YbgI/SA1388 family protein